MSAAPDLERQVDELRADVRLHAAISIQMLARLDSHAAVIKALLAMVNGNQAAEDLVELELERLYAGVLQTNESPVYEQKLDLELDYLRASMGRM